MSDASRHVRRQLPRIAALAPGEVVPSPCNCVCRIDAATGWCDGCLRTLDEIGAWSSLDARGRLAVWDRLAQRATAVEKKAA